jgi:hypothetical protein
MLARKIYLPHQLNIRVYDDLMSWLVAKADAARVPPSTYARRLIEAEAKRDLLQRSEVQGDVVD